MRTVGGSIGTAIANTTSAEQPGLLIQIDLPTSGTFRLSTFDVDFPYNGFTWDAYDVQVAGLSWNSGPPSNGRLVIGDPDLVWWTFALELELPDSPVKIWQAYMSAQNEAIALWSGRVGVVRKGNVIVDCDLVLDTSLNTAPRRRVQTVVNAKYLLPAGKVIMVAGQKWVLERKSNG